MLGGRKRLFRTCSQAIGPLFLSFMVLARKFDRHASDGMDDGHCNYVKHHLTSKKCQGWLQTQHHTTYASSPIILSWMDNTSPTSSSMHVYLSSTRIAQLHAGCIHGSRNVSAICSCTAVVVKACSHHDTRHAGQTHPQLSGRS